MERAWAERLPGGEPAWAGGLPIRELVSRDELEACVALQEEVWGPEFAECVPAGLLSICGKMGGVVAGAFDGERLVAFVFGITGLFGGEMSHWSHMLGVRPGIRDGGLGFRLKAYQRDRLLALGVRAVRWTFDPLESRNAHLNLSKLGIVVRKYVPEMYGESGSPLHGGIGTDRFVALWRLDGERARRRMRGVERPPSAREIAGLPEVVGLKTMAGGLPVPRLRPIPADANRVVVSIPAEVQALKEAEPDLAWRWRQLTRQAFTELIRRRFEVRELVRGDPVSRYVLELRTGR